MTVFKIPLHLAMDHPELPGPYERSQSKELDKSWNMLFILCASGDLERVKAYVEAEGEVPPSWLSFVLFVATFDGHYDIVSYLLSLGAPLRMAAIEAAIRTKSYRFMELFLASGFNINEKKSWYQPASLVFAFDDPSFTKWLLCQGASPNALCDSGMTPLSVAVEESPFEIIKMLFEDGGSVEFGALLHHAVRRKLPDYLRVVNFILSKRPAMNQVMYHNDLRDHHYMYPFGIGTPLHEAAHMGRLDVAKLLVEKGGDPWIWDARGRSAIELAARCDNIAVASYLITVPPSDARQRTPNSAYGFVAGNL